jgi:four helix bundle protein
MASYQDLTAWQVARANALAVHRYVDRHWSPQRASAFDQLRRAALSVPLNISEGQAFGRGPRCKYHLRVALGSAVETHDLLTFLRELGAEVDSEIETAVRVQQLTFKLWKAS